MSAAYCPHCQLTVADDVAGAFPPIPMACPHCRLTIAVGRARDTGAGVAGASGSAAGLMASAARRGGADSEHAGPEVIDAALRHAAEAIGTPVQRLRMIDYQRVSAADGALPGLATILDARGSWKNARRLVGSPEADAVAS